MHPLLTAAEDAVQRKPFNTIMISGLHAVCMYNKHQVFKATVAGQAGHAIS